MLLQGLFVGIGGFVGAVARFYVTVWLRPRGGSFPVGTLTVNVLGSLALGFLATYFAQRATDTTHARLMLTVGVMGSFTTFSTFSHESVRLWHDGRWQALAANIALNVGVCLLAAGAGAGAARLWAR
jgi:fluoride exporter